MYTFSSYIFNFEKILQTQPLPFWLKILKSLFNGKLRDELLIGEIFTTLLEARAQIKQWRKEYNEFRPHSALDYRSSRTEGLLSKAKTLP
jgi:transposase InsO family protein